MGHTLVLNTDGLPIGVLPLSSLHWQDAVKAVYLGTVTVLHTYENWKIHSPSCEFFVPSVVMAREYVKVRRFVGFSPEMAQAERTLKRFMYATLYHSPSQLAAAEVARGLLSRLFAAYAADPSLLPDEWRAALPEAEPQRTRHIADFIAGMTDRYAIARHKEVVGPVDLPEGF